MGNQQSEELSLWKRVSGALAVAALFAVMAALDREPEVTAAHVADADDRKALKPGELCISQFGAGERWTKHHHVYECVSAAREIPSYILSMPVAQ
jgi:hypothetical protein